jgi:outer membrane lipoprotein-sorting protein
VFGRPHAAVLKGLMHFTKSVIISRIVLLPFYLVSCLPLAEAGTNPVKNKIESIKQVIRSYNEAPSVKMDVSKSVFMAIMGETKTSEGEAAYAKGKLRLKMNAPEDSLVVMDQSTVWIETPGVEEGKPQVAKITAKDMKKRSRAPLAILFSNENAWNEFKIIKSESSERGTQFWLEPKDLKKWTDLRKISLTLSKNGKRLEQLSYEDELENKTEFVFKNIVTDQKLSARTFRYAPPPGAEITVYE